MARDAGEGERRPRSAITLYLLLVYAAAWLAARGSGWPPPELLGSVGVLPAGLLGLALVWRTTRYPGLEPAVRRAWRLIGAALLLNWLGDCYWAWLQFDGVDPETSAVHLLYLLYYPVLLLGLLSFPSALKTPGRRLQFALDAATVVLSGGMVVWHLILAPRAAVSSEGAAMTLVALAYPVGDLVLLLGLAVIALGRPGRSPQRVSLALMAALAANLAGDLVYGVETLGGVWAGGVSESLFLAALVLFGVGAHAQRSAAPAARESGPEAEGVGSPSLIPYLAAAAGLATLLLTARRNWTAELGVPLLCATLLIATVLARALVAGRENLQLQGRVAARRSEARFQSLIQNASDVIMVVEDDTRILYQTLSVTRVLGYQPAELAGRALASLAHPDEAPVLLELIDGLARREAGRGSLDCRLRRSDARWLFVEIVAADLRSDPDVGGIVLTLRDVHQRKRLEAQLTHQALHDPLTDLANRSLLTDRLEQALARARRAGQLLAVLFIDLDAFKAVNDSLGHRAGDLILAETARRIRGCIRVTDTAARLGGDEFGVLLEDAASQAEAAQIAERVVRSLREPFRVDGQRLSLSVSVGLASSVAGREAAGELLRNADAAMYAAKRLGKNRLVAFEPGLQVDGARRLELASDLSDAVAKGQFVLHYQPIVSLGSRRVEGAEALVRWAHPQRGLLSPDQFVAMAEETDQDLPLARWILREALVRAACWEAPDRDGAPPYVSINLSLRQLQDVHLVRDLLEALAASRLDPRRLVLEITESLAVSERLAILERLEELRKAGVRLAIDDFGTGYASLTYLDGLPVDLLKLDRVFVEMAAGSSGAARLARGIVELGRSLGMTLVAEGIESTQQAEALLAFGCEQGQGFHFSRPLPAEEFAAWLARTGTMRSPA